jgi:hypothetical protein
MRGGNRTISGAFRHVANSLGFNANQIDTSAINALETAWWTPRGEYFDYEASSDSASAKDIFDKITEAGMSYFCCQMGSYLPGAKVSKPGPGSSLPRIR